MTFRVMQLTEAFGQVIRTKRRQKGFSQEFLAELAELHPNFISLVERAKTSASLDSVQALANALGCQPSVLLLEAELLIATGRVA